MSSFTPEARVIAAFTVVVALLTGGWHHVAMLALWLTGGALSGGSGIVVAVLTGAAVAVVAVATLLVARNGVATADAPWAVHLGQATVGLSVVVIATALLAAITSAVNNGGFGYFGMYAG